MKQQKHKCLAVQLPLKEYSSTAYLKLSYQINMKYRINVKASKNQFELPLTTSHMDSVCTYLLMNVRAVAWQMGDGNR